MKRLDYKMQGKAIPMFKSDKTMPKVIVTEEDKRIREKLWKAETHLDRILGKLKMGFEVTELEKKRVPFLKSRIEHLKSKLFENKESKSLEDEYIQKRIE